MRKIWSSAVIVIVALGLAAWAIAANKLRMGKDLAGGVSLVYAVNIAPGENAQEVLNSTIDVLKRRVDPDGLMEITMMAQGNDRIEIAMPLPSKEVKAVKKQFEDALAQLGRGALNQARVDAFVKSAPAERAAQIETLSAGSESRRDLLMKAAVAWDESRVKRAAYDAEADPARKDAMVSEVSSAELAYDQARNSAIRGSISADEVRAVVNASKKERVIADKKTSTTLPSAQKVAADRLRAAHPESEADIDRILGLYAAYDSQRTTLDDPQDLIRMLRGAGVLSFRITVKPGEYAGEERAREELLERGPQNLTDKAVKWCRVNDIQQWINSVQEAQAFQENPDYARQFFGFMGHVGEAYAGDYYLLCYDTRDARLTTAEGNWRVSRAYRTADTFGRSAIGFEMDPTGSVLLGKLTEPHIGDHMGVLLDEEVYTAPVLNGAISSRGTIEGSFTEEEIQYIVRVLAGGSLRAKLSPEPISVNAVGPELGADNLQLGLKAGVYSLVLVAGFMLVYYFSAGMVAVVALFVNSLMIVGAMALSQAAFTLPGIAGLILTFGMAVDSNVLIFERMREEMQKGADLRTAVRVGFDRALSSIVDGNVTNLIVCVVLYYLGTTEIRGFAITMGIGVVSTLFAALVVSRVVFDAGVALGWRRMSMLPMAIPGLQRLLTPNVNWIKLRWVFFTISAVYVVAGLVMVGMQGRKMLDNEFLGGTQVTLALRETSPGTQMTLQRPEVAARVDEIAGTLPAGSDLRRRLENAEVFPIEPQDDGVTSSTFVIKTRPSENEDLSEGASEEENRVLVGLLLEKFSDVIETRPGLQFAGSTLTDTRQVPAYPVEKDVLGANIDRPDIVWPVKDFLGGVAIVIDRIEPPQPLASLEERLRTARESSDFSDTLSRRTQMVLLSGNEQAAGGVVLLVRDDAASMFESDARWERELRDREWSLVQRALTEESTPASVQSFSSSIASTFRANAIAATLVSFILIGIYIWVRFKTPRYSIAAVVALVHDVVTVVGLLALCEILYESPATHDFAVAIGLLPFKIDLNAVAALLTIAGYSLNDTVVVMDRIRENRGKLQHATAGIINLSINQTFSRTIITGGTTMGSCIILYFVGGEGMRAFAFTLLTGLIVGTYSSVAVAAPIVWARGFEREYAGRGGILPAPV